MLDKEQGCHENAKVTVMRVAAIHHCSNFSEQRTGAEHKIITNQAMRNGKDDSQDKPPHMQKLQFVINQLFRISTWKTFAREGKIFSDFCKGREMFLNPKPETHLEKSKENNFPSSKFQFRIGTPCAQGTWALKSSVDEKKLPKPSQNCGQ
ncbi:hypothetical protein AV530_001736 [Patagioenas fasciata monilis]|uniref:Uncharacterized protein n=1 Tax=Patagioenas fasciata monilis TaxID=372326 RepID=A0A1V4KM59_PATFA|nr:hypothetical protein AV530_001736 [Patagioenas fasciata monilis]